MNTPPAGLDPEALSIDSRFFELYERMLGNVDLHDVLRQVTDVVRQTLNAERATIYLVVPETHELESAAVIGNVSRMIRVPISATSLAGYCALSKRAFSVPDAHGDLSGVDPNLHFDRSWDERNRFRTRDVLCAPALFRDEALGVVQVINSRGPVPFRNLDLPPLQAVSRLVGYALYHARLYNELATLKALRKQKAQFMRIMVHELKSPVAAAKMLVSGMQFAYSGDKNVIEVATRVGNRLDDLLAMVQDILHFSRVQAGQPLGEITVFDMAAAAQSGCEAYAEPAAAKDLDFRVELPETPVMVRFDRQGFQLVLSNLVSNAVKYTNAGTVTVSVAAAAGFGRIRVCDTGIGIPADDIPQMCQEFFRASNARGSAIRGTGVGLTGVKELVERFGGHLALESELNVGSVFTVTLPLAASEQPAASA